MSHASVEGPISASCVICATPRSGSWLLAEGLLQTGIAGKPEEYFRPDWYQRFATTGRLHYRHMKSHRPRASSSQRAQASGESWKSGGLNGHAFSDFLRGVRKIATTDNGVLAIKIHWHQLERVLPSLRAHGNRSADSDAELLESWFPHARYVFLRRADKVRQAVSFHRALRSGVWWSLREERRKGGGLPHVDLGEIDRLRRELVEQDAQWQAFFQESSREPLELWYEDLAENPRAATAAVLRFLGLDPSSVGELPKPRLRRQADGLSAEQVQRYWVARRSGALDPREGLMRTETIVVDNFYADPARIREYALKLKYYFPYQTAEDVTRGRQRVTWMASRFRPVHECPFKSSEELVARLEELTGEEIDLEYWRADFPLREDGAPSPDHRLATRRGSLWNCCFHCKPETGQPLGVGVHNHVVDTWNQVGPNGWSGVIYLNPIGAAPLSGGLKIWRNRDPARNSDWMTTKDDWELVDDLGNVPNRLILYRGNLPHSGAGGWGDGLRSGRLCQTFYFKTVDPVLRRPLALKL
jgi:LPS sulfotransferase NodH